MIFSDFKWRNAAKFGAGLGLASGMLMGIRSLGVIVGTRRTIPTYNYKTTLPPGVSGPLFFNNTVPVDTSTWNIQDMINQAGLTLPR